MLAQIRVLGFDTVEIGHDLRMELTPGVCGALAAGTVRAASVHNFCPAPPAFPRGGPDIYSPCARDGREIEAALRHTRRTLEFASEIGAEWVVLHAGRVEMAGFTGDLIKRYVRGERPGDGAYDRVRTRRMMEREKKAPRHLDGFRRFLDDLLPEAERRGRRLAIEVQPAWESFPTELELLNLLTEMNTPLLRYWHDIGHGQVRENLGFINHLRWLERLAPFMAGIHVHDVAPPARDHLPPGRGSLDFSRFAEAARRAPLWVFEPHPQTPAGDLAESKRFLRQHWREGAPDKTQEDL